MKYIILFMMIVITSAFTQHYHFDVECGTCTYNFQNVTILPDKFPPGLVRMFIRVNISNNHNHLAMGNIHAYMIPNRNLYEPAKVMNIIFNQTRNFNHSISFNCNGERDAVEVAPTLCTTFNVFSNCYYGQVSSNGYPIPNYNRVKSSSNIYSAYSPQCDNDYNNCNEYYLNISSGLDFDSNTYINTQCMNTNTIYQTEVQNIPQSGVLLYKTDINFNHVDMGDDFYGSFLFDTGNYPNYYFMFYTELSVNNVLHYDIIIDTIYISKYDEYLIE